MNEGSTVTLLEANVARHIGINGLPDPLSLTCVGNLGVSDSSSQHVKFGVGTPDGTIIYAIAGAWTVRALSLPHQSLNSREIRDYAHLSRLPIEHYENAEPRLLIGQDHWDLIIPIHTQYTTRYVPAASFIRLRWVVDGQVPNRSDEQDKNVCTLATGVHTERYQELVSDSDLHALIKVNFNLESIGITRYGRKNRQEARAEYVLNTASKRIGFQWKVGLLWKNDNVKMPNDRQNAFNHLMSLERRMDRDPEYGKKYCLQFENFFKSGYAQKLAGPVSKEDQAWYLPHFGTTSSSKPDRIRLVFDAAAKTKGVSLNDNLLSGPDLFCSLLGVLMRFRQRALAFMGDIREIFLQIKIRKEDRASQRFFWRGMDRNREPDTYVMTSMIFGATSSPGTAQYTKNRNAREFEEKYPLTIKAIAYKHYVDNYLDSVDTVEEGIERIREVTEIHRHGGFEIRGWTSNSESLLKALSIEKHVNGAIILSQNPIERALSVKWSPTEDQIAFNLNINKLLELILDGIRIPTKREMLGIIMSVFDPLRILMSYTIRSKILLQEVWCSGIGWDDELISGEARPDLSKEKPPKTEVKREFVALIKEDSDNLLPNIHNFAKWLTTIRSTAIVLFSPEVWKRKMKPELTPEFLELAELLGIKKVQRDCFNRELLTITDREPLPKYSPLLNLSPIMSKEEGVIRIEERINATKNVPYDVKSPIILDGKHLYTQLLVKHYHDRAGHAAPETVGNELKQKYWILKVRPTVRSVSSRCQLCRVRRAILQIPRMGDLPIQRLGHHQRPFTFCGIDYFGPMMVMIGRRREKRWGVLITCLTTRAVHLELAALLSTDSAIIRLRRMMARGGKPSKIYSDNGTNLTGMNRELGNAIREVDHDLYLPSTLHMGDSWERLVRSVKVSFAAVLNERAPKEEVLHTLLVEVEHVINSRTLTHVSVDHRDMESLTLNHFLIKSSSEVTVPGKFTDKDLCFKKMWRKAQRLVDMFWSRWMKEYLPNLLVQKSWIKEVRALSVDDVVLMADETLPRNIWPKEIITDVYPGKAGRIRNVDVRTRGRTFRRSVANIVVFVPASEGTVALGFRTGGSMFSIAGTKAEGSN